MSYLKNAGDFTALTALNRPVRSLLTAIVAGLLGFAAAKMGGSSFTPKQDTPTLQATPAPQPARETAVIATPAPAVPSPDPAKPIADRLNDARRSKDPIPPWMPVPGPQPNRRPAMKRIRRKVRFHCGSGLFR